MEEPKKKEDNPLRKYVRFSTVALQMGIVIAAGALGGRWIDQKQGDEFPLWTLILTLIAIFGSLFQVIREVIKMGKEDEAKKNENN